MNWIRKIIDIFLPFGKQVSHDKVPAFAAQAAFFIIISAVPLVMLVLSLLQYIMPITQSELSLFAMDVVPLAIRSYVITIIDELYTQTSVPLISITAVTTLWAASRSVYGQTNDSIAAGEEYRAVWISYLEWQRLAGCDEAAFRENAAAMLHLLLICNCIRRPGNHPDHRRVPERTVHKSIWMDKIHA